VQHLTRGIRRIPTGGADLKAILPPLIAALVAFHQAVNAVRALRLTPDVSLSAPLEFVASLLWAGMFALLALRRRARPIWLALIAFAVYSAARIVIFARADYDRGRVPVLLIIIGLIMIVLTLFAARSQSRNATAPPME
jgi:hypothetical protein